MSDGDLILHLKYPWQQFLLDAFLEINPKKLRVKVGTAQRAISLRLSEVTSVNLEERLALTDALRSLRTVFASESERRVV